MSRSKFPSTQFPSAQARFIDIVRLTVIAMALVQAFAYSSAPDFPGLMDDTVKRTDTGMHLKPCESGEQGTKVHFSFV